MSREDLIRAIVNAAARHCRMVARGGRLDEIDTMLREAVDGLPPKAKDQAGQRRRRECIRSALRTALRRGLLERHRGPWRGWLYRPISGV